MKRLLTAISILCLIATFACGSGSDKSNAAQHVISGVAATGAYMPDGAIVQLRPTPVPTGNTILVGSYNGIESWVAEENPADIITGQVDGGQGDYNIDVTGTSGPFLIRVQDPVSSKWYYSYVDDAATTANVNPFTDWMVRYYYRAISFDVDQCFTTGRCTQMLDGSTISFMKSSYGFSGTNVYWYNMPLPTPNDAQIRRAMAELQYVVNLRWGVDIGDVLTRDWIVGESYDSILDGSTLDVPYITTMLNISYCADDMMNYGVAYYDTGANTLRVEVWSTYAYCRADWPDGTGNTDLTLIDTVDGVYHYMREAAYTSMPMQIMVKMNNVPFIPSNPGAAIAMSTYTK